MLAKNNQDVDNFLTFGVVNTFLYVNYKEEREMRVVVPLHLRFGRTAYHEEDQWLLECFDIDKKDYRTFALSGIVPR